MVTTGTLIENTDAKDYFIGAVQTPAHNTIVYHVNNRHNFNGIQPVADPYDVDNPPTGASEAGLGADGTTITATTVYDHLVAATYNITKIRQAQANFYLLLDGGVYTLAGSVGPAVTVRNNNWLQTVSGVDNAGVSAGSTATAASYNDLCTNLYNTWNTLKENRADFRVNYCHSSCHSNCHTSRGRR